jgi:heme-degrading monooxygenase HmoA
MAVKVLITRQFKSDKVEQAYKLLMELRALATVRTGYLSGETLIAAKDPTKMVVISTWVSPKAWQEWENHPKRKEFQAKMPEVLQAPEHYEVFWVGEKMPEWVDMA